MTSEELQFRNNNPGAVQYGNFINYYDFNSPSNRIDLLPTNIWTNCTKPTFLALDIGCNAGNLTHELSQFLQKHLPPGTELRILAVDIDNVLIQRAQEQYSSELIEFQCCDTTTDQFKSTVANFLKDYERTKFDAVFCFSTTMWIHLNKGDVGLQNFLKDITRLSEIFIVEPQPWKCYASAVKRMKKTLVFPHFCDLQMRFDVVKDIERFIIELGMNKEFESDHTEWKRKIFCFRW